MHTHKHTPAQVLRGLNCLSKKKAAFACMSGQLLPSEISSDVVKEMEALKIENEKADRASASQHRLVQHRLQDTLTIVLLGSTHETVMWCVNACVLFG